MKHIVVIGGGMGGTSAIRSLCRRLDNKQVHITLIDPNPYQTFHSSLYEIATSPEEIVPTAGLRSTAILPFALMFKKELVTTLQTKVISVDHASNAVKLENGKTLLYDYLITGTGATPAYHNIPGAEKYSLPLRSTTDALRIRYQLETMIQTHRSDVKKPYARLVILGGGVAGVELAAEAVGALDFICWKYNYPRYKAEILVIEAANDLASGLSQTVSKIVFNRLRKLGVKVQVNSFVAKVEPNVIELQNGERWQYDCLIWTGGIKGQSSHCPSEVKTDDHGRLKVDAFLCLPGTHNAFVLGDVSCIKDSHGNVLPAVAPQAIDQGDYIAGVITNLMKGKEVTPYQTRKFGYVIPMGGHWAILSWRGIVLSGFFAYLIREFVILKYFIISLGIENGLRLWVYDEIIYSRNDD